MSKYDTQLDPGDESTSHAQMLDLVGHNKRVLDVGCATGYLAKALRDQSCDVSGVEYEAEAGEVALPYLDRLVVGDLETLDLVDELGESSFDVVVFGDVLEHLRDPLVPLRQAAALLRPGGSVVISVPNVAHGAVRLSLLAGQWDYRSLGLMDYTHIRFFTRKNLIELLRQAGLIAVDFRRTTAGLFETELGVQSADVDGALVDEILTDPDATTYQFVLRAIKDDGDAGVRRLAEKVEESRTRIHALERELAAVTEERNMLGVVAHDRNERAESAERRILEREQREAVERTRDAEAAASRAAVEAAQPIPLRAARKVWRRAAR